MTEPVDSRQRIAVIGPGAIGGTVAAWLAQAAQNQVTLCARTAVDSLEIETPDGRITAQPRCLTLIDDGFPVDWILIATKAYDAVATASWLPKLTQPGTRIAILQNGVEHVERFAAYWARETILPVIVECPAERTAPGRIRQRRAAFLIVPSSPAGVDFQALFKRTSIDVRLSDDFISDAWRKLCLNCAGAVSALVMKPGGIVHRDDIAALMHGLIRECIAVARAEGATLDDTLPDAIIAGSRSSPLDSVNSMLADRLAGRPMEIDARNQVIVRLGARHGIATPLNELMVTLLTAAQ